MKFIILEYLKVLAPITTYSMYVLFGLVYFSYFNAIPNTNRDWAVDRDSPSEKDLEVFLTRSSA